MTDQNILSDDAYISVIFQFFAAVLSVNGLSCILSVSPIHSTTYKLSSSRQACSQTSAL